MDGYCVSVAILYIRVLTLFEIKDKRVKMSSPNSDKTAAPENIT